MTELEANSQECVEQSDTAILQIVILILRTCVTEQRFAAALLKLEHLVHVPGTAVDVF